MRMIHEQAGQIAALINRRNKLDIEYTPERILKDHKNYISIPSEDGDVIACIEIKKVQWYQCEIRHLAVHEKHERRGLATSLMSKAEALAKESGAKLLQCTIRLDNVASLNLCAGLGFRLVSKFASRVGTYEVGVFQKVLS